MIFGVFEFFQKMNERILLTTITTCFRSFFGRNRRDQKSFRNYLTFRNDIFFSKIPTYFFQYLFGLLFSYSNLTFISLHYLDFYIHFLLEFFPLSIGNFIPLFYFDLYFFPILTSIFLFYFDFFSPLLPIIASSFLYLSKNSARYLIQMSLPLKIHRAKRNMYVSTFFAYLVYKESFVLSVIPNWGYLRPTKALHWHAIHLDSYAAYGASYMVVPSNFLVAEPQNHIYTWILKNQVQWTRFIDCNNQFWIWFLQATLAAR